MKLKNPVVIYFSLIFSMVHPVTREVPSEYTTIQAAIDASYDQDTVLISPGTYQENISYDGKNIVVMSTYLLENDSTLIDQTIINGNENGSVVVFADGESENSVLQGLTLTNGNGNYADPDGNGSYYTYGGGVYCQNASPILKDLIIKDNSGNEGGGGGIFCYNASPTLTGCSISDNITNDVGGGLYARDGSNVVLINVEFTDNEAEFGAGCYLRHESVPSMTNVIFADNIAANSGGGIVLKDNADAVMDQVHIEGNIAEGLGGGLYINNADPNIEYCLIADNTASSGGGLYVRNNSDPLMSNITIAYNNAGLYGDGIYLRDGSDIELSNSLIWGNNDMQVYFREQGDEVSLSVSYSDIENGQDGVFTNSNGELNWGAGMLDDEPYFCNGPGGNYSLRENSPCMDASETGGFIGCFDAGCGPINTGPVWYVDINGDDQNDGSSDTPFATIQRGIDVSVDGDTVRLNPGSYTESFDLDEKAIVLESMAYEFESTDLIGQTIFTTGPMGGACLELYDAAADNAELRGFMISGGQSQVGGGMIIENCSPRLVDLIIENNSAEAGGGVYLNQSNSELVGLIIRDNGANLGGGIYITDSAPTMTSVTIESNIAYWGAGAYFEDAEPLIISCTFRANEAFIEGGAIYQGRGDVTLFQTALINNIGLDFGGAIVSYWGMMNIAHSTFAGNNANYGSVLSIRESAMVLANSIIWGNGLEAFYSSATGDPSMLEIHHTDIEGGSDVMPEDNLLLDWGDGNIDLDPQYCDPENGVYGLQEGSPCWTASDSGGVIGAYQSQCGEILSDKIFQFPYGFELKQNYPNPFNPVTTIEYSLPRTDQALLSIYSLNGYMVRRLVDQVQQSGAHRVKWDGRDDTGKIVSAGMYITKLESSDHSTTRKLVFIK